jgi:predicted transcriptional regulator
LRANELKDLKDLFRLYEKIFGNDIRFLILKFLSNRDCASIREIARNVGMSHKNLVKYLDHLVDSDALEVVYTSSNIKLYKLSQNSSMLKKLFKYQEI